MTRQGLRRAMTIGISILGFLLLTILLGNMTVEGKTWYVDDSGGADFTTIQDAIDSASDNDTVMVSEGTYWENVAINITLRLIGAGPENTTIDANGNGDPVNISAHDVRFEGFNVSGSGIAMDNAGIKVEADRVSITNMKSYGNFKGIVLGGNGNSSITSSDIDHSHGNGIEIISDNNTVSENTIFDNDIGVVIVGAYQILDRENNTIRANEIYNNRYGIQITYCRTTRLIENMVHQNSFSGIMVSSTFDVQVFDNTIQNNTWNGIYGFTSDYPLIRNNSIINNDKGIYMSRSVNWLITGNEIRSNRIGILQTGGAAYTIAYGNRIFGNRDYGIDSSGNFQYNIDARYNWWGSDYGPYNHDLNPIGKGDNITEYVQFDPWTGKEFTVKYVDDDAPDGGNGTKERPYTSIQTAVNEVLEGGIVNVWDGIYEERVTIDKSLIIVGNGTDTTMIDGQGVNSPFSVTVDSVNLSGVSMINSGADPGMGGLVVTSDNNHIYNISCAGNGGTGIILMNATNNYIHWSSENCG